MRRQKKTTTPPFRDFRDAEAAAAVAAFHPGPGADYRPPEPITSDPVERLNLAERDLLELSINRFASRDGRMGDLARLVIVRRAEAGKDALNV